MKWHMVFLLLLFSVPLVAAIDFNEEISEEDRATFDEILTPVMKVYTFIKYTATIIAVMVMLFAGVKFMINGEEVRKRDEAKNMATFVLIGLVVIWAAPLIVNYLV